MSRERLNAAELAQRLTGLAGWVQEEEGSKWIVKSYRFPAFMDGIAFVGEAARLSEAANHHPMIAIDYKKVTLRLTTWSAGGLTELDLELAARFDEAYASYR
ncbi:4a-hydroxytetrahydrobiopterin dehydratase [Paenibacillus sp. YYML68]|uniref:4a-hydroxytetrahydrobiopterin dehydratase n=1 Tax=Paenibacillus sp. YYML68 TaxID=2909250 RepID=UPI0024927B23|nr:4a-hydroxytetrahydrobiopterin dehydratase [Paenibacillus sp. YYML68]